MPNESGLKIVGFNLRKHIPQSSSDKTNDLFYILASLYMASNDEKTLTKIALEKALFQTQKEITIDQKLNFFNTFFYVNTLGPHNNLFYKYLGELEESGLLEVNANNIFLTLKGMSAISTLMDNLSEENKEILEVLLRLKNFINKYYNNNTLAINETHEIRVRDITDNEKIKTIKQVIKEIKPEQQFSALDFKYIYPIHENFQKISLPPKLINDLETILANVKDGDLDTEDDSSFLFS